MNPPIKRSAGTLGLAILAGVAAAAMVAGLSGCEDGSYFSSNTRQMKSDAVGRIEADGVDLRAYEFTPQTMPGIQCVFVVGTQESGLYCAKKAVASPTLLPGAPR